MPLNIVTIWIGSGPAEFFRKLASWIQHPHFKDKTLGIFQCLVVACRERIITGAQGVESTDEIAGGWCIGHAPDETCPCMGYFGNGGEVMIRAI